MIKKLQQRLLDNNPFPSLRNDEETFFSLLWQEENNISDLCNLVVESPYQLRSFSCCVILTLRVEGSFLFLTGFPLHFNLYQLRDFSLEE